MASSWTDKQRRFVEEYTVDFNATQAAIRAGYSERTAAQMGSENLRKPKIAAAIKERLDELSMSAAEATKRMSDIARADIAECFSIVEHEESGGRHAALDLPTLFEKGLGHLVKKVKWTKHGPTIELYNGRKATETIMKQHGLLKDRLDITTDDEPITDINVNVHPPREGRLTE